ncbi:hypothetical protein [Burkholderia cenocepacia]|uniref:hypothetical protein n=1 Tax=Burkholderia cenocepacia TaxID=95486 RepID=UPI001ED8F08C|nr:hypothetical protein [Burkholderia cenocepacia]
MAFDARHQPLADIGVMERQQMADRALRLPEMEGDWTLVMVDQTRRKVSQSCCYRHNDNLVIFCSGFGWIRIRLSGWQCGGAWNFGAKNSKLFLSLSDIFILRWEIISFETMVNVCLGWVVFLFRLECVEAIILDWYLS